MRGFGIMYIASNNRGKIAEFVDVLGARRVRVAPVDIDYPPEDQNTYVKHAVAKARACFEHTGVPSIGDDSGLEVRVLDGAPGILSARYGGPGLTDEQRIDFLLDALDGAPRRSARYVCALAYCNGEQVKTFRGLCYGRIAMEARGDNGFGYDPVFEPVADVRRRTLGEMNRDEKDVVSHRVSACYLFSRWLDGQK